MLSGQRKPIAAFSPSPTFGCTSSPGSVILRKAGSFIVFSRAPFRLSCVAALIVISSVCSLGAENGFNRANQNPSYIVVGFVGGFVRHDDPHHGPVQFAERIRSAMPNDSYIQVFENRHRKAAYRTIVRLLDRDRDGSLTEKEKEQARIILFGQSWGGSAVVMLARELRHAGVPVMLTIQIDSVAKPWQKDQVIPQNVEAAVNFYQPHGLIHGQPAILAADPARTRILGNYRFDYREAPVLCKGSNWVERFFTPSHAQSECDPNIWSRVEGLVRERIHPRPSVGSIQAQP